MLKQRILTALILGPLILWSVIAFSHTALAIELGIFLLIAGWEWARISGITSQAGRIGYSVVLGFGMALLTLLLHEMPGLLNTLLYFIAAWWALALLVVINFDRGGVKTLNTVPVSLLIINLAIGLLVLLGAFVSITAIHQMPDYGYPYILVLLMIIWVADSAAYFTGKALGKHKLAPNVSPGKSWEGVAGALIVTSLAGFAVSYMLDLSFPINVYFVIIVFLTVIFSIAGDLFESLFKRRAGVKDSSHLLPGHGGILDRIDSLVSASPVFLLGLLMAGV